MMTTPDPTLTALVAAHLVETVTPLAGDIFLIDCTCGAEVRFAQGELDAAPVDSTTGALHYMLRDHVAASLSATHVVIPRERAELRYYFCGHPAWPDPLRVWPPTLDNARRHYEDSSHPDAWVGSRIEQQSLDVVIPKRSEVPS